MFRILGEWGSQVDRRAPRLSCASRADAWLDRSAPRAAAAAVRRGGFVTRGEYKGRSCEPTPASDTELSSEAREDLTFPPAAAGGTGGRQGAVGGKRRDSSALLTAMDHVTCT
ncbi:hypothetical protein GN956_G19012 [Arapaima gigas]